MTRTFRKRTSDTSGRRVVPSSQGGSAAYPGRKTKGSLCQLCENLATGTVDIGRPLPVRVCDRDACRDAARRLGEEV